jgi:7,8-dihydropterin-6-yl-methyl-4-(beta-D-ribofuranosyl)aminobenzene 5'-phosphate synthase
MTEKLVKPADRAEVTILVDNYADLLVPPSTPVDHRLPFDPCHTLLAEHGLSCLVRVFSGKKEHAILLDAGLSRKCLSHNARQLGLDLSTVEAIVLSHGHFDHTGGLTGLFCSATRQVPLILHPDAFLRRRLNNPSKEPVELPQLDAVALKKAGADILQRSCSGRGPRPLLPVTCSSPGRWSGRHHSRKGSPAWRPL